MTRLADCNPVWVHSYVAENDSFREDGTFGTAQGIMFDSPFENSSILLWFKDKGIPDSAEPGPGRWTITGGTTFEDLTLSPSVDLTCAGKYPGRWHGFIIAGEIK